VSLTLERIESIFGSMGFDVAEGPEIVSKGSKMPPHQFENEGKSLFCKR